MRGISTDISTIIMKRFIFYQPKDETVFLVSKYPKYLFTYVEFDGGQEFWANLSQILASHACANIPWSSYRGITQTKPSQIFPPRRPGQTGSMDHANPIRNDP